MELCLLTPLEAPPHTPAV